MRTTLLPLLSGAIMLALASAAIDLAHHQAPFRWAIENVRQNIVEHRADRYGIAPRFAFIAWYMTMWRWWTIPLLVGLRAGWRHAPAVTIAALVDLALHSLIGHKEYRFVYLTTCALVIVAAIGWGALLRLAAARLSRTRRRWATLAVFAGWTVASLTLATDATMAALRREGRAGSILFAAIRHDPAACGVAVVEDATFADVPGSAGLRPDIALAIFAARDPAYGTAGMRGALARWAPTANRIVTTPRLAATLPAGYAPRQCESWETGRLCLFARPARCTAATGSPFAANTALRRLNF